MPSFAALSTRLHDVKLFLSFGSNLPLEALGKLLNTVHGFYGFPLAVAV